MQPVRLIAAAGSTRRGSFNRQLVELAASAAELAGAEVRRLDLGDLDVPLYQHDLETREDGFPPAVRELRRAFEDVDGWLIATPEYNGSVPALMKNTLDWLSRPGPGEPPLALRAYRGKVAGLLSASPGGFGGLRALSHLGYILNGLSMLVLPGHVALPLAHEAFTAEGELKDAGVQAQVEDLARRAVHFARAARLYDAKGI